MSENLEQEKTIFDAWNAVERISVRRVIAQTKDELLEVIEEPLKPAIGLFFDKGIETMLSSCNLNDYYSGKAWVSINYGTLSEENRAIANDYPYSERAIVEGTDIEIVGLFIPIEPTDFPRTIAEKALEIAEQFSQQ